MMGEPINPNAILATIFETHGVAGETQGEWVVFPETGIRACARIHDGPSETIIQLDIRMEIWPGWDLVESCAGIGEDRNAAIFNGFEAFMANTLHVLLAAFFFPDRDDLATCERWTINGTPRKVTISGATFRGNAPSGDAVAWFPEFEAALKAAPLSEGDHWIRLFYAQDGGAPMSCEALLDNQTWPEMERAMEGFAWTPAEGYYSVRLFLVVQGGVGVGQACSVISRAADEVAALEALGVGARRAALLYGFIVLAFGRPILESLGVAASDKFLLQGPDGERSEGLLMDEPIFVEALAVARSRNQLSREQLKAISMQSCEVDALNEALNAGHRPEDLKATPPVLFLPE